MQRHCSYRTVHFLWTSMLLDNVRSEKRKANWYIWPLSLSLEATQLIIQCCYLTFSAMTPLIETVIPKTDQLPITVVTTVSSNCKIKEMLGWTRENARRKWWKGIWWEKEKRATAKANSHRIFPHYVLHLHAAFGILYAAKKEKLHLKN